MKTLTIKVNVQNDAEAYKVVALLGFEHDVTEADLDGHRETFDKDNRPNQFLKDNSKMDASAFQH